MRRFSLLTLIAAVCAVTLAMPVAAQQPPSQPSVTVIDPTGPAPAVQVQVPLGGAEGQTDPVGPCGELQRESCDRAGRSFLIAAAAYALLCAIAALLLNRIFYRKGTFGQGLNILVPIVLGATAATLLMGLDPARDPNFIACLACTDYRSAILLSGLANWPRALVLGALPVGLLSFFGILILNKAKST